MNKDNAFNGISIQIVSLTNSYAVLAAERRKWYRATTFVESQQRPDTVGERRTGRKHLLVSSATQTDVFDAPGTHARCAWGQ